MMLRTELNASSGLECYYSGGPIDCHVLTLLPIGISSDVAYDSHSSSVGSGAFQELRAAHDFIALKAIVEVVVAIVVLTTEQLGLQAREFAMCESACNVRYPAVVAVICKAHLFFQAFFDFTLTQKHSISTLCGVIR